MYVTLKCFRFVYRARCSWPVLYPFLFESDVLEEFDAARAVIRVNNTVQSVLFAVVATVPVLAISASASGMARVWHSVNT
jgi:hypothetical protein